MTEQRISFYSRLVNTSIVAMQSLIEQMFPENKTSIIEQKTVLLSDGKIFECSIETNENKVSKDLYLAGHYYSDIRRFHEFLSSIISEFNTREIIYDIDFETKENGKYIEHNIRHPKFIKMITPPSDPS